MKKGKHIFGRKNQSLYDTNLKIQDRESVELVLNSDATRFESGTANVRARPTVKHHAQSSFEPFQGFAVPTPKVPDLPTANGPKLNGTGTGDLSSTGSVVSTPGHDEEIFVPPPPSKAPPPPPVDFIPPPPDFMGDLNSLDPVALQPPSMPAPKPPSMVEEDLSHLKPPPMAPPKPLAANSSVYSVPVSHEPPAKAPERPKFAPPQPPSDKHHKSHKLPPPKPLRSSSVAITDSPPHSPAPPPPAPTTTLSTFNPQNKAKVYDPPKNTFREGFDNQKETPKMLVLQESGSGNSAPAVVTVDGKVPQAAQLTKPVAKPIQELREALEITKKPELPEVHKEAKTEVKTEPKMEAPTETKPEAKADTLPAQSDIMKPLQPPPSQKTADVQFNSQTNRTKMPLSSGQGRSFSPLLDRKLYNLKANEAKPSSTSPLDLLKAAKEREKRKTQSLSRESSISKSEPTNAYTVLPRSTSSVVSSQKAPHEYPVVRPEEPKTTIKAPENHIRQTTLAKDQKLPTDTVLSKLTADPSPAVSNLGDQRQRQEEKLSKFQEVQNDIPKEVNLPLLPPPPEFGDLMDQIPELPPSIRPPDPPTTKAPTPPVVTQSSAPAKTPVQAPVKTPAPPPVKTPAPPPAKTPAPPKLPPPEVLVKSKQSLQSKPSTAPTQLPPNLSPNQATLLSILQKKMLEMDHKMNQGNDSEHNSDDWSTAVSDEDHRVPAAPQPKPAIKNPPTTKQASLDMRELETKVAKKHHQSTQVKSTPRNGIHSRHQYGMTFTIRPGTKQPMTLVSRGDS
ncbi:formin-like protein 20 [Fundulus heteroclitus]|uniref:formin-like protein 20 n=1 Tax=Fundulus heteroclitus TaxID=8078 RepID=UPI00165BBF90|nr:formin-like protein 20 [Fundulus heteroclitus]